jgi:hypothetical protein
MNKPRERAGAAVAAKSTAKSKGKSRPKANKVRSRAREPQADEQAPAREVVVRGTAISLPGLRFLDE